MNLLYKFIDCETIVEKCKKDLVGKLGEVDHLEDIGLRWE